MCSDGKLARRLPEVWGKARGRGKVALKRRGRGARSIRLRLLKGGGRICRLREEVAVPTPHGGGAEQLWNTLQDYHLGRKPWRGRWRRDRRLSAAITADGGGDPGGARPAAAGAKRYRDAAQGGGSRGDSLGDFRRADDGHADFDVGEKRGPAAG